MNLKLICVVANEKKKGYYKSGKLLWRCVVTFLFSAGWSFTPLKYSHRTVLQFPLSCYGIVNIIVEDFGGICDLKLGIM